MPLTRRNFLGSTAKTTAAAAVVSAVPASAVAVEKIAGAVAPVAKKKRSCPSLFWGCTVHDGTKRSVKQSAEDKGIELVDTWSTAEYESYVT